jgi:DNA invertase Pin-like site-specific DNA recombinase
VPFVVTELGADVDPFVLHLFAAQAQKQRALISQRTKQGSQAAKRRGIKLGGWTAGSERSAKEAARAYAAGPSPPSGLRLRGLCERQKAARDGSS